MNTKFLSMMTICVLIVSACLFMNPIQNASAVTMESPSIVDVNWGINNSALINLQLINSTAPYLFQPIAIGSTFYALTHNATLVTSSDCGLTWELVYDFAAGFGEEDPSSYGALWYSTVSQILFASLGSNSAHPYLYRSANLGLTWSNVMTFSHLGYLYSLHGMTEDPVSGIIYVGQYGSNTGGWGTSEQVYINKSSDAGLTWSTETTIIATHIHGVQVGYDRTIFAGYGDTDKSPNTFGTMSKPLAGAWANVTWLPLMWAGIIGGINSPNATYFLTDGGEGSSVPTYKAGSFKGDLLHPGIQASPTWYTRSVVYVDDVVYAGLGVDYSAPNMDGSALFASPDEGDSWYRLNFTENPSEWNYWVVGYDGSPYIIWINTTGRHVYAINNVGKQGIEELMYGGKSASSISASYSASAYIGNANYSFPLYRNGIHNPTVTLTAINLTNLPSNWGIETAWNSEFDRSPSDGNYSWNTEYYTEGTHSVRVNMGDTDVLNSYIKCKFYPISGTYANTIVGMFDARKDPNSSYFYARAYIAVNSDKVATTGRYLSLTDSWQTYAVMLDGTAKTGWTGAGLVIISENPSNQTAYFDNFKVFKLPSVPNVHADSFIIENHTFRYNIPKKTANITAVVDGTTHTYGLIAYNNGTVVDSISLTGDFYSTIPVRITCDGCVLVTVSGSRLSYGSNVIGIPSENGWELRGGSSTDFFKIYNQVVAYTNVLNIIDGNHTKLFYLSTIPFANAEATGLAVSTVGEPAYVNVTTWASSREWGLNASNPLDISFTISGLDSSTGYKLYKDGEIIYRGVPGGNLSFSSTGNGTYQLLPWYPASTSRILLIIPVTLGIGILLIPVIQVVTLARNTSKSGRKIEFGEVINQVVAMVVGLAMVGIAVAMI